MVFINHSFPVVDIHYIHIVQLCRTIDKATYAIANAFAKVNRSVISPDKPPTSPITLLPQFFSQLGYFLSRTTHNHEHCGVQYLPYQSTYLGTKRCIRRRR